MALKLKFVIVSAIYLLCSQINETEANQKCHLEQMKHFALNSCELLIEALNGDYPNPHNERLKREILDNHGSTGNGHYDENRHVRPTHLRIKDNNFPPGGYIVLDHLYAKLLRRQHPSKYHVISKELYQRREGAQTQSHNNFVSDGNTMSNEVTYRRRKRHHDDRHDSKKPINVTYCCLNHCRPYDLCEF